MLHIYLRGFKNYLQLEKGLSENSIEAYLRDLKQLASFFDTQYKETKIEDLELVHLQAYVSYLSQLELAASSQSRMVSSLKAFFNFLVLEKKLDQSPAELLEAPKQQKKLPTVLSFDEIEAILSGIDLSKPEGHRNRAMLEILYACGLRASELVGLQLSHLFLDLGFIKVLGKGNKERLVPVGEAAIKQLQYYLNQRNSQDNIHPESEDIVFLNRRGKKLTRNMLFLIVKDAVQQANIKKNISPHSFRHSFATHLIEGGADLIVVQQLLGHVSVTTTEIYTHLDMRHLQETLRSFHPRGLKK